MDGDAKLNMMERYISDSLKMDIDMDLGRISIILEKFRRDNGKKMNLNENILPYITNIQYNSTNYLSNQILLSNSTTITSFNPLSLIGGKLPFLSKTKN